MRLYYFTESFPYGIGESWKKNEIEYLSTLFEELVIVPLWNGGCPNRLSLEIQNVIILNPALDNYSFNFKLKDFFLLFNLKVLIAVLSEGAWKRKRNLIKVLLFYKRVIWLRKSASFKYIERNSDHKTVWYFFWGRGWADLIPFLRIKNCHKVAVRLHGYDLYKERNFGYIPFREKLLKRVDVILPVSDYGKEYIIKEYTVDSNKIVVSRLGTTFKGKAVPSFDGILRVVSCSGLVPIKRIDRIITAFKQISNITIEWTHIGDGPLRATIEDAIRKLPHNISVTLTGHYSAKDVESYYLNHPVDVFLNSSESEGVPISIMEAFSYGIPVIASNVGGTGEIVDQHVGILINNNCFEQEFLKAIQYFNSLSFEQRNCYRNNALNRFKEKCDAYVLAKQLGENLIKKK